MLNMQFDKSVVIDTREQEWEASPMPGVWRKPLACEAAEHGHTTSLVRVSRKIPHNDTIKRDPYSFLPDWLHPR